LALIDVEVVTLGDRILNALRAGMYLSTITAFEMYEPEEDPAATTAFPFASDFKVKNPAELSVPPLATVKVP
jgi:hypothetical protein